MAFELIRTPGFPGIVASNITLPAAGNGAPAYAPVLAASGVERGVAPVASTNQPIKGFTNRAASIAQAVRVLDDHNVVKVVAGASIGVGAEVGIASINGAMGPITGASGVVRHSAGTSETAAAPGEIFSLHVRPRQLSGTP